MSTPPHRPARARWSSACALVLVLIGLGAGCGDDADPAFGQDYKRLQRQVNAFSDDVARTFNRAGPTGDLALAPSFGKLADRALGLDRRLAKLRPPDSSRSQVDRLRASLGRLRQDLGEVVLALRQLRAGLWVASRTQAASHLRALRSVAAEPAGR